MGYAPSSTGTAAHFRGGIRRRRATYSPGPRQPVPCVRVVLRRLLYRVFRRPVSRPWCSRALGALLVLCASAASAGDSPPREYLDEETGATVTLQSEALVFTTPGLQDAVKQGIITQPQADEAAQIF